LLGQFGATGAHLEERGLAVAQAVGQRGDFAATGGGASLKRGNLGATITELLGMPGEVEVREAVAQTTEAERST